MLLLYPSSRGDAVEGRFAWLLIDGELSIPGVVAAWRHQDGRERRAMAFQGRIQLRCSVVERVKCQGGRPTALPVIYLRSRSMTCSGNVANLSVGKIEIPCSSHVVMRMKRTKSTSLASIETFCLRTRVKSDARPKRYQRRHSKPASW